MQRMAFTLICVWPHVIGCVGKPPANQSDLPGPSAFSERCSEGSSQVLKEVVSLDGFSEIFPPLPKLLNEATQMALQAHDEIQRRSSRRRCTAYVTPGQTSQEF